MYKIENNFEEYMNREFMKMIQYISIVWTMTTCIGNVKKFGFLEDDRAYNEQVNFYQAVCKFHDILGKATCSQGRALLVMRQFGYLIFKFEFLENIL